LTIDHSQLHSFLHADGDALPLWGCWLGYKIES